MHPGQLALSVDQVAALVADQFPQWRGLPVLPVRSTGTVNALFRLGDDLVLRFPLLPGSGVGVAEKRAWLAAEAAAARRLVGRLPVPSPEPMGLGEPGRGYPLPWAAYRWLPGVMAGDADVAGSASFARDLGDVVVALRSMDTEGRRFSGDSRGGLLTDADGYVARNLADADGMIDTSALGRIWARLRTTPRGADDVWTHGDLMPGNLLARDGRLAAVIDVGGLASADPALDLQPAWNLLGPRARQAFRHSIGSDDDEWDRGKGWALAQAIGCLHYYRVTNPPMSETARHTLQALLDDRSP
jgi:aminoglycoside phosphotransferase (APT) family kinase protein